MMTRWAFHLLALFSLLLAILIIANYFRDPNRSLHLSYQRPGFRIHVACSASRFAFVYAHMGDSYSGPRFYTTHRMIDIIPVAGLYHPEIERLDGPFLRGEFLGITQYWFSSDPSYGRHFAFPLWYCLILFTIAPLIWTWSYLKKSRHKTAPGHCSSCNYDLRAHHPGQRCPECGTLIPEQTT